MNRSSDHNLLFGILATQLDFLTQTRLTKGLREWLQNKEKPLGELLVERGWLSSEHFKLLNPLVEAHTQQHDGDVQQSLAALSSVDAIHASLAQIDDSDLNASLATLTQLPGKQPQDDENESSIIVADLVGPAISGNEHSNASVDNFETSMEDNIQELPSAYKIPGGPRFRILRPHAEGGLGKVSVALDSELQREVAFKEIKPRYADEPATRARFLVEAEVTGGLEHPGIVPVYGLGHFPDGRPFYAMRFIRGQSLLDAVKAFHAQTTESAEAFIGNRDFRDMLNRLIDVCNAIQYAHDRKVLHRDLKPGNIMLGNYGETLVVDWGLAKAVGSDSSQEILELGEQPIVPASGSGSAPTRMGSAIGTPQYMPPEQASGNLEQLGPPSDIYSLGATLYEALTGQPPLAGAKLDEVLRRVAAGQVPPPCEICPYVPIQLDAICRKAMSLRSEDRYPSARLLANDLEAWLSDEPVTALKEPLWIRTRRWMRRHQTLVNTTVASVLLAIVGLSVLAFVVANKNHELATANSELEDSNAKERQASELATENAGRAKEQQELAEKQTARLLEESAKRNVIRAWREYDKENPELALLYMGSSINQLRNANTTVRSEVQQTEFQIYASQFNSIYQDHPLVRCWPNARFAAYSPDASRIVTCEANGYVSIWATGTNRLVWDRETHQGAGTYAAFDTTGRLVVCGSHIGEVSVLDTDTQEIVYRATLPHGVSRVWFANEHQIAALTLDETLTIFDLDLGEQTGQSKWSPHSEVLAYAPSGKTIAIASGQPGRVRFVDVENLDDKGDNIDTADQVVAATFSQDSQMLMTNSREAVSPGDATSVMRRIQVWSVESQTVIGKTIELSGVVSAAFAGVNQVVVATAKTPQNSPFPGESSPLTCAIARYDIATGRQASDTIEAQFAVREIVTSPDGHLVVAIGSKTAQVDGALDDCFQVFDLSLGRNLTAIVGVQSGDTGVEFNAGTNSLLVFGHGFGFPLASEWDLSIPSRSNRSLTIDQEPISRATFHPTKHNSVIAWTDSGKTRIWDKQGAAQPVSGSDTEFEVSIETELKMETRIRSMPTSALLKTGEAVSRDTDVTYNVAFPFESSFQIPASIANPPPENQTLSQALKVGIPMLQGNQHYAGMNSQYTLAAAQNNANQDVRVWNISNGDAIAFTAPLSHNGYVQLGRFSNNSRFLATAAAVEPQWDDPAVVVRVWDCLSAQPVTPHLFHDGEIQDMQFNQDASTLLVQMENGVHTWSLQPSISSRFGYSKYALARCIAGKDIDSAGEPVAIDWNSILAESLENGHAVYSDTDETDSLFWHQASAQFCIRNGLDKTALRHVKNWLKLEPSNAVPHRMLGGIHGRNQNFAEAERAFESAAQIAPDVAYCSYRLAVLAWMGGREGDYKSICKNLRDSLTGSIAPDNLDLILWTHALSSKSVRDFSELLTAAERNVDENPGIRRYLNTLAIIAYRAGNPDRSREALNRASTIGREFGHEVVAEGFRRLLSNSDATSPKMKTDLPSVLNRINQLRRSAVDEKEELALLYQTNDYEPEWVEEAEFSRLADELEVR